MCRLEGRLALFCNMFVFCFQIEDTEKQLETANKEQETMIELFAEERKCRDQEEENLKKKLRVS